MKAPVAAAWALFALGLLWAGSVAAHLVLLSRRTY